MPSSAIQVALDKIAAEQKRFEKCEGNLVSILIRMGVHFVELKAAARRRWQKEAASLGYSARDASRYLAIGTAWWVTQPPTVDILNQLPANLHCLEILSKLSPAQLDTLLLALDPKTASRAAITTMVNRLLGRRKLPRIPTRRAEVADILSGWSKAVAGVLDDIDALNDGTMTDEVRQILSDGLQSRFAEVEAMLGLDDEDHDETLEESSTHEAVGDTNGGDQPAEGTSAGQVVVNTTIDPRPVLGGGPRFAAIDMNSRRGVASQA